ncbi:MAG: efflux RND transporter periplasmic adaptor subunit [Rhodospirillaceae bacterium]
MSIARQVIVLLAIAGLAAAGAWLWTGMADADGDQRGGWGGRGGGPTEVVVATVETLTASREIEAVGTAQAAHSVMLYPKASGTVEAVLFRTGEPVKQGAVLLRLDDEDERLAAELARVEVEQAAQLLARFERSVAMGAVSASAVDEARTDLSRARIAEARAAVALEHRAIIAPFDGIIGLSDIDPGNRVDTDTAIASLDDRTELYVDFELPEAFAQALQAGASLTLKAWSQPDRALQGTVEALDSRVDPETRTLMVRARLPNPDDRLRPGMSFAIQLSLPGEARPAVPEVAVLWSRDGAYVWRLTPSPEDPDQTIAEQAFIDILRREDGMVLVGGDLAIGDRVVVEGVQRVRNGRPVAALEPSP